MRRVLNPLDTSWQRNKYLDKNIGRVFILMIGVMQI